MTLADTHCHLDLEAFDSDRPAVIARAAAAGVERLLIPSIGLASASKILALTAAHAQVFGAVGVHPTEAQKMEAGDLVEIESLAAAPKIVAIGEIGLDYYWVKDEGARSKQRELLRLQLGVARRSSRPVILHMREAGDAEDGDCSTDMLSALAEWTDQLRSAGEALAHCPGVLHSFSGSLAMARQAISMGFAVGVTGPITFKNAERRRRVVAELPLESLLVETDAPFLAPVPHRGRRNEPAFVVGIADRIAAVQSRSAREVHDVTSANASRLFAWDEVD